MSGRVLQVSTSPGGIPKRPVLCAELTPTGLAGDGHRHPHIHGGPRKALLLVTAEGIEELNAQGFPLYPGALGENITTTGLDRRRIRLGQRYRIGEAIIEISHMRQPCQALEPYGAGLPAAVFDARVKAGDAASPRWGLAGFYASVVQTGAIRPGDPITLLEEVC
jgi:MOSC domain-containing protein YiiM